MNKEQEKMVLDNKLLVYFIANKMKATGYNINEDAIQNGFCGLCYAARKYNPNKGKFSTYAVPYIENYIKSYYYRDNPDETKYFVELDKPMSNSDDNITLKDCIPDDNDYIDDITNSISNNQLISKLLSYLDKNEKTILLNGVPKNKRDLIKFKKVCRKVRILYARENGMVI